MPGHVQKVGNYFSLLHQHLCIHFRSLLATTTWPVPTCRLFFGVLEGLCAGFRGGTGERDGVGDPPSV